MFKTKRIKELEEQIEYLQKDIEGYKKDIEHYKKICADRREELNKKNEEIASLIHENKKCEILEKYYKLDEEPSIEVQARVRADLRIHEMEYNNLLEKMNELKNRMSYLYQYPYLSFGRWY